MDGVTVTKSSALLLTLTGIVALYLLVVLARSLPQLHQLTTLEREAQRSLDEALVGVADQDP